MDKDHARILYNLLKEISYIRDLTIWETDLLVECKEKMNESTKSNNISPL